MATFARNAPEITRSAAESFRQSIAKPAVEREPQSAKVPPSVGQAQPSSAPSTSRLTIMVRHQGALHALRVDLAPSTPQHGWIQQPGPRGPTEVLLKDLQLDCIVAQ